MLTALAKTRYSTHYYVTIAGITGADFFKCHMACHESLKGCFTSKAAPLCPVMCTEFHLSLSSYGESGEKEMYDFVQEAMFESVTRELFGRDNVPKDKVSVQEMTLCHSSL